MARILPEHYLQTWTTGIILLAILAVIVIFSVTGIFPGTAGPVIAVGPGCTPGVPAGPVFTAPSDTLSQVQDTDFTLQLYTEAVDTEPLLATPGTRVHMGFWSGPGNHGSMLRLLDAVNEGASARAVPPHRAIWDEGTSAYYRYPSYARLINEHWYERASALNGSVIIFGRAFTDPHPVTFAEADEIWGEYSARYTAMAEPLARSTGNPVKAWCFVQGAKANRIFYTYELPQLRHMEQEGLVQVYFARTPDARWTEPGDWINGTINTPAPYG